MTDEAGFRRLPPHWVIGEAPKLFDAARLTSLSRRRDGNNIVGDPRAVGCVGSAHVENEGGLGKPSPPSMR